VNRRRFFSDAAVTGQNILLNTYRHPLSSFTSKIGKRGIIHALKEPICYDVVVISVNKMTGEDEAG